VVRFYTLAANLYKNDWRENHQMREVSNSIWGAPLPLIPLLEERDDKTENIEASASYLCFMFFIGHCDSIRRRCDSAALNTRRHCETRFSILNLEHLKAGRGNLLNRRRALGIVCSKRCFPDREIATTRAAILDWLVRDAGLAMTTKNGRLHFAISKREVQTAHSIENEP